MDELKIRAAFGLPPKPPGHEEVSHTGPCYSYRLRQLDRTDIVANQTLRNLLDNLARANELSKDLANGVSQNVCNERFQGDVYFLSGSSASMRFLLSVESSFPDLDKVTEGTLNPDSEAVKAFRFAKSRWESFPTSAAPKRYSADQMRGLTQEQGDLADFLLKLQQGLVKTHDQQDQVLSDYHLNPTAHRCHHQKVYSGKKFGMFLSYPDLVIVSEENGQSVIIDAKSHAQSYESKDASVGEGQVDILDKDPLNRPEDIEQVIRYKNSTGSSKGYLLRSFSNRQILVRVTGTLLGPDESRRCWSIYLRFMLPIIVQANQIESKKSILQDESSDPHKVVLDIYSLDPEIENTILRTNLGPTTPIRCALEFATPKSLSDLTDFFISTACQWARGLTLAIVDGSSKNATGQVSIQDLTSTTYASFVGSQSIQTGVYLLDLKISAVQKNGNSEANTNDSTREFTILGAEIMSSSFGFVLRSQTLFLLCRTLIDKLHSFERQPKAMRDKPPMEVMKMGKIISEE